MSSEETISKQVQALGLPMNRTQFDELTIQERQQVRAAVAANMFPKEFLAEMWKTSIELFAPQQEIPLQFATMYYGFVGATQQAPTIGGIDLTDSIQELKRAFEHKDFLNPEAWDIVPFASTAMGKRIGRLFVLEDVCKQWDTNSPPTSLEDWDLP